MKKKTKFEKHVEDFQNGKGTGNLLAIEDIDPKDMAVVAAKIFVGISDAKDENEMYCTYLSVLSAYGIMCPHPQHKRLYSGWLSSKEPLLDYGWYTCTMCNCSAINEYRIRKIREEKDKVEPS